MNKLIRTDQLVQLVIAHFKELIRQPEVIFWGFIFPILMSLGLGIAFSQKTDIVRSVAVIEKNNPSDTSRQHSIIDDFLNVHGDAIDPAHNKGAQRKLALSDKRIGNTIFLFVKKDWQDAILLLKRGSVGVIMEEADGRIIYHFDPLNIDAQLSYLKLSNAFARPATGVEDNHEEVKPLTVRGTRYIDFLIPGLISMDLMMSIMWGMSYGMIERRSRKLLRRMVATPMKKSHFLAALMFVRIAMNFIESALLVLFAYLVFDVTIQGSAGALCLVFLAGNIAFGGIAIFVSSHTANTETGNGLINAVVLPMTVLSGVFFSYHNFPEWSIPFIQKLPLTLLADGIRSVFIEGAGIKEIILPSAILSAVGAVFFTVGLKTFKWH
jgi:ABC-type multidrug transport system permease subunit